jgi:hypothetical protein
MKNQVKLFLLLAHFYGAFLLAQPHFMYFNTATSNLPGAGSSPMPPTSTIPYGSTGTWYVSQNINAGYVPAIHVPPVPSSWNSNTFAYPHYGWITWPNYTCTPGDPANHGCYGMQDLFFKITFTLPSANPVFALNWWMYCDNSIQNVYINRGTYPNPVWSPNAGSFVGNATVFQWCKNWVSGTNEIIVHIRSGASSTPISNDWIGLMINSLPPPPLNITGPNPVCPNTFNLYTATNIAGATSYNWTLPLGWGNTSSSSAINALSNSNSGVITVSVNSGTACPNAATMAVNVYTNPITIAASANPVCQGQPVTLIASGANSYTWTGLGLPPTGIINSSITFTPNFQAVYTVKGITQQGCVFTKTISVGIKPLPSISISASPPFICPGSSNVLTATGTIGNNYLWGNPTVFAAGGNVAVTPGNGPATYTAYAFGTNGCSNTASITLVNGPTVTPIVSNTTLCTNASSCVTLSVTTNFTNGPVTYNWLPVGTGTAISVCMPLPSNATYTVNASSPAGCPSSATMAVSVTTNCCSQPTTGLTALPPSIGNNYSNTGYFIPSNITLTNNTTFSNAEFLFMPNTRVIVPSGITLTLDASHLYACGINMWDGIEVQDGGRIVTLTNKATTLIEDAKVAIDLDNISLTNASPNAPIDINYVVFNKNHIGIKVSNSVPALNTLALGIKECVFTSRAIPFVGHPSTAISWPSAGITATDLRYAAPTATSGLTAPYLLQSFTPTNPKAPYASLPGGYIGIKISNIGNMQGPPAGNGVVIGSLASTRWDEFNLFDQLGKGIHVTDASLTTHNNVFQNMLTYPVNNPTNFGTGIQQVITGLMNSRLYLSPPSTNLSTDYGNRFWDVPICIIGNNSYEVDVQYNLFRRTPTALVPGNYFPIGIGMFTNRHKGNIQNNEFNNITNSIGYYFNSGNYDMGSGLINGTYADNLEINFNYIGRDLNSLANTPLVYANSAISISVMGASNWQVVGACKILSNKINRVFRGIATNETDVYPIEIGGNDIKINNDIALWPTQDQYGIYCKKSLDNLLIKRNIVIGDGYTPPNNNSWNQRLRLIWCEDNQSTSAAFSPIVACNNVAEGYIGFEFTGNQPNTDWQANEMTQCMDIGLNLTNMGPGGGIGPQGSLAWACSDRWYDNTMAWPSDSWTTNHCQTMVDATTDASFSFLYGENPPIALPVTNCAAPGGTAYLANVSMTTVPKGTMSDCKYPGMYAPAPSQRTMINAGIASQTDTGIQVFPNPSATGRFTIQHGNEKEALQIEVFDINSKKVYNTRLNPDTPHEINLEYLNAAMYMLKVTDSKGVVTNKKIVIQK